MYFLRSKFGNAKDGCPTERTPYQPCHTATDLSLFFPRRHLLALPAREPLRAAGSLPLPLPTNGAAPPPRLARPRTLGAPPGLLRARTLGRAVLSLFPSPPGASCPTCLLPRWRRVPAACQCQQGLPARQHPVSHHHRLRDDFVIKDKIVPCFPQRPQRTCTKKEKHL